MRYARSVVTDIRPGDVARQDNRSPARNLAGEETLTEVQKMCRLENKLEDYSTAWLLLC